MESCYEVSAYSLQGFGKESNQDYCGFCLGDARICQNEAEEKKEVKGNELFAMVSDGVTHSFHPDTLDAAETAVQAFLDTCGKNLSYEEIANVVNEAVVSRSNCFGNETMATTMIAAMIQERHATILAAGDSPAYLLRDGKIEELWDDKNIFGILYDFLGNRQKRGSTFVNKIDIALQEGDTLILASDGVSNPYVYCFGDNPKDIQDRILIGEEDETNPAKSILERTIVEEKKNMFCRSDDKTAIVIKIK